MQGDPDVLKLLNEQLTSELTAINQYFLHSKMQENWGFTEMANHTRAESFDEMRHAEAITDRILILDGLPNYQRLFSLRVGQTLREQFEADLAIEYEVMARLKPGDHLVPREGRRHQRQPLREDHRRRGEARRLPRDPTGADGQARRGSCTRAVRVAATARRSKDTPFRLRPAPVGRPVTFVAYLTIWSVALLRAAMTRGRYDEFDSDRPLPRIPSPAVR